MTDEYLRAMQELWTARLCQARGRSAPPALTLRNDVRVLRPGQSVPASAHGGRVLAGEPTALIEQISELAECGVEHLVLEFLAADGRELDEQMSSFAERVRPRVG
jgi:alkanesulfonate monooxygenase SsuD/methylene tetrahydromethanopterin reductase-like flavin-dependent oxidoreductase (luciferase family)